MHSLKWKVKHLERRVIADKAKLSQQSTLLNQRIKSKQNPYFAAKIIFGSFAFGFILGLMRHVRFREKLAEILLFLNTVKMGMGYVNVFRSTLPQA